MLYCDRFVKLHFILLRLELSMICCWQLCDGVTAGIFRSPLIWTPHALHFNCLVLQMSEVFRHHLPPPYTEINAHNEICGQKQPWNIKMTGIKLDYPIKGTCNCSCWTPLISSNNIAFWHSVKLTFLGGFYSNRRIFISVCWLFSGSCAVPIVDSTFWNQKVFTINISVEGRQLKH